MALSSKEKFDLLVTNFDEGKVTVAPFRPKVSGIFVVDTNNVDWCHTALSWLNKSSNWRYYAKDPTGDCHGRTLTTKEIKATRATGFVLKTSYFNPCNAACATVRRIVTSLKSVREGEIVDERYAIVQYIFPAEKEVVLLPQKRKGKPFVPTAPSTKAKIIQAVQSGAGPNKIAVDLYSETIGSEIPGSSARGPSQIKYYRTLQRKENRNRASDSFAEILLYSKKDPTGKCLIRNLQSHSEGLRFILATKAQAEEIVTSCCQFAPPCGILSIDTTFNIGKFFVTPTSYPVLTVINKRTKKYVNVLGPCLFHEQEETTEVYRYFADSLVEMCPGLENVRFIGGDRGTGQQGFMKPFHGAVLLPCTRHVQNTIKEKIGGGNLYNEVITDLFGRSKDQKKGLVDCSRENFDGAAEILMEKWPDSFSSYFKAHLMKDMKAGMLHDVRQAVGLDSKLFYNNALEYLNKEIKAKKQEKQLIAQEGTSRQGLSTWKEAVEIYKDLIFENRCFIHQAVIGKGPYELAPGVKHLAVDELEFAEMNPEMKRSALARVDTFLKPSHIAVFLAEGILNTLVSPTSVDA